MREVDHEVAPRLGPRRRRARSRGPRRAIARGRVAKAGRCPAGALWVEQRRLVESEPGESIVDAHGAGQDRPALPVRAGPDARRSPSTWRRFPAAAVGRQPGPEPDLRGILPGRGARAIASTSTRSATAIPGGRTRWSRSSSITVSSARRPGVQPKGPPFPEAGDTFEEFQLVSLLGRGGTSRVFLARDLSLGGKQVVLKVSLDRGREPQAQGALDHPHIVPVNSVVFGDDGMRGLSMPYRPGLPLDEVIRRVKPGARGPARAMALWEALVRPTEATTEPAPKPEATSPRRGPGRRPDGATAGRASRSEGRYRPGRGLGRQGRRRGAALRPRPADVPPRRQAGERPADPPARPAAPRLQPGRVARIRRRRPRPRCTAVRCPTWPPSRSRPSSIPISGARSGPRPTSIRSGWSSASC